MRAQLLASLLTAAALLLLTSPAQPRTWHILPDGSGDAPTIQAGVDSATAGDTVELACGTYYEHDIVMKDGITVRGAVLSGCSVINAQIEGRCFYIGTVGPSTIIEGLTMTNACGPGGFGGAICIYEASPTISKCRFIQNVGSGTGGAIYVHVGSPVIDRCWFETNAAQNGGALAFIVSSPTVHGCTFIDNWGFGSSAASGGAVWGLYTSVAINHCVFIRNWAVHAGGTFSFEGPCAPVITNCTTIGSRAPAGGGLFCSQGASPLIENTIFAFGQEGGVVWCDNTAGVCDPRFTCCDLFGNAGGDWTGCIAGQANSDGNFSAWPLFCYPEIDNYTLSAQSPCLPGNHPAGWDCGLIGALGQGCGPVALTPQTWARVKARYR